MFKTNTLIKTSESNRGFFASFMALLVFGLLSITTAQAQTCTPQTVASWNLDACYSLSNHSSSSDYSEFTPTYPSNGGFSSVNASIVGRGANGQMHSCAYPRSGASGKAMCVDVPNINSFQNGNSGAVKFTVTMTCGSGQTGKFSGLEFWETAPTHYSWYGGASGTNNYPRKYGVRILKNGTEVFRQVDINTSQSWNKETFDFSSNSNLSFTGTATFTVELLGYSLVGNGASVKAWDLDDIVVKGCCAAAPAGNLTITCPSNISTTAPLGSTSMVVNYANPTTNTTCNQGSSVNLSRTSGPASGSSFVIGTTQVCYQATDNCGNVKSCCFNVTVNPTNPPAIPSLTINDVTVNENAGTASLQICASGTSTTPITVQYSTSNGTAVVGSDYSGSTGTATIPAGSTCTTVTFPIVDDNINEPTESFNVTLTNPNGATIADPTGTVTILDNDTAPSNDCNAIGIVAGNGQITVNGVTGAPIVSIQVFDGNWNTVFNNFYTNSPGSVVVPSLPAGSYFVKVQYLTAAWSEICKKEVSVSISGGTPPPSLTINDVTVNENAGTATVQICASSASSSPITVQYSTANGTAMMGADYSNTSGTATIPAGSTCTNVTIPLVDDNTNEPTETFNINLNNPTGATIADPTGVVTILDNDSAPVTPTVSISDVTVNENAGTASLQICASSVATSPISVTYSTSNGSATAGSDYTTTSGTATIPAGATCTTVTFPIVDDNTNEPTESFNVTLGNPTGATINDGTGTVTILDNDTPGGGTPDCNAITVTSNNGNITVTGVAAPVAMVQVFSPSWATVLNEIYYNSPGTVTVPGTGAGQYYVKVTFYNASWGTICQKEVYVTVGGGGTTPSVSISDVTVNENAGTASMQICASAAATSPITVQYSTSNGSAVAGSDYTSTFATATIPAGSTCTTVTFPIVDDNTNEPTESFNVTLSNPTGATINDGTGTVTILDNDSAPVTPSVSISDVTVNENAGTASLQICASSAATSPISVTYSTSNGSAIAGSDYTATSGTATIPTGATCTTVTFPIVDDNTNEPTESFNVTLGNPTGATINDGTGTVTILDNDTPGGGTPDCNAITVTSSNGNIIVTGVAAPVAMVQVFSPSWATVLNEIYYNSPGTVTVPGTGAGQYYVKVTFYNASWGTICQKEVYVTVGGGGTTPSVSISDVTVNENAGTASLQICASSAATSPITVQYSTSNGSAVAGSDYTSTFATATIPAGSTCTTVTFPIVDDNTNEPTESFNVTLSNPTGATINDGTGTVTILDNDSAPVTPSVSISDVTVNENAGTASLQICASSAATSPISVTYSTSNGSAIAGSDYTATSGTATIPAGATCTTVTFPIVDDNTNEPTESFNVTLGNPTGATINDGTGTVTILDNDSAPTIPSVSVSDVTVNENAGTATLQVCLSQVSSSPVTVQYSTANGTAIAGSDYSATFSSVTIPANTLCAGITVPLTDDTTNEPTESFTVNLLNPTGATIGDGSGNVTILDNDPISGPDCNSITVTPGNGTISVGGLSAPVLIVQVLNSSWNQVFNEFYTNSPGTVTVPNLPSGTYYVKVTFYTAAWQQTCQKEFTITVTGAPTGVLTFPAQNDITVTAPAGQPSATVNYPTPSATSTCTVGSVSVTRISGLASGSSFPIGTSQVCYRAVDGCGNQIDRCFNVIVNAPAPTGVLTFPAPNNITVTAPTGQTSATVNYPTPTASSTCTTGSVSVTRISGLASGSSFPVGTSQVCYRATDGCGNQIDRCFNVIVNAPAPPTGVLTFPAPNNITVTAATGQTSATVNYPTPSASSTCTVGSVNVSRISGPASGSSFPVGTTQVCYRATDGCGNQIDRCFNVIVNAPAITCTATRTVTNTRENCGSGTSYGFWINVNYPGTTCKTFALSNATFVENADGTANLTAVATNTCNSNIRFNVDVDFCGRTYAAPSGSPKPTSCYSHNSTGWYYYTSTCGLLTGTNGAAGAKLRVTRTGPAFQVGMGANEQQQHNFGASGWLNIQVLSQPSSGGHITSNEGDFNINLSGSATPPACGTGSANCNTYANCNVSQAVQQISLAFEAYRSDASANLRWYSNAGAKNDYFIVERSNDQQTWTSIGTVEAEGNATFAFTDAKPNKGVNFYRLTQMFADGSSEISEVKLVRMPDLSSFSLYPNPAKDFVVLDLTAFEGQNVSVRLINQIGTTVRMFDIQEAQSQTRLEFGGQLQGVYSVEILSNGVRRVSRLVIADLD